MVGRIYSTIHLAVVATLRTIFRPFEYGGLDNLLPAFVLIPPLRIPTAVRTLLSVIAEAFHRGRSEGVEVGIQCWLIVDEPHPIFRQTSKVGTHDVALNSTCPSRMA